MAAVISRIQGSTTVKVLLIGFLTLLLLIPLSMIRGLITERQQTMNQAQADIARAWGGQQIIGGPILVVPVRYRARRALNSEIIDYVHDEFYVLPAELTIEGGADTQVLERGIYEVPVFSASLSISGALRPPTLDSTGLEGFEVLWSEAVIALPIRDARPISEQVTIDVAGNSAQFGPGGERVPGFGNQLIVSLAELGIDQLTENQPFTLELEVGGSESLHFHPLGDTTRVALQSGWPDPSFQGNYLPVDREVSDEGFAAEWRVLSLGRGYPAEFRRSEPMQARGTFGVRLMPPLTVHAAALKASKYGVLFVGLSFIAFFLFEIFRKLRLHPVHYLSVGMANVVFYLLLIALAEHVGFGLAYFLSAIASTALITAYATSILHEWHRALPIMALLSGTYLQLYMILNAEDHAVLMGALTLFALLAGFMYLTRNVDWYSVDPAGSLGRQQAQSEATAEHER